mmetsp:Transcript_11150/g.26795  ORF Transcript_11150/g.26795 Transcript_11150/m.26795 type:complete len:1283 (-) Transcript_11150:69-3917(-)
MESDGNEKNSTETELLVTVHDREVIQEIGVESIMKSSDNNSASIAKDIVENPSTRNTMPNTVVDSLVASEDKVKRNSASDQAPYLNRSKELGQRNNLILTNSIRPGNTNEDTDHVNTSRCDESKIKFVESEEETQWNEDKKSTIDLSENRNFEFQAPKAFENEASPIVPSNYTDNISSIPSPVNTDFKSSAKKEAGTPRSSMERKGQRLNSKNNNLGLQIPDTNLQSHNQQGKSDPTSSRIWQPPASLIVSSLPIDSLHNIASFLIPIAWKNFGKCNKATNKICKEIFRRVRMHGFRCATEVVTAWKFGQHADAKELCGLYVSTGVPIYPHCLGHSYHTLLWRLSIEAKYVQEQEKKNTKNMTPSNEVTFRESMSSNVPRTADRPSFDPSAGISAHLDPFFSERDDFREREDLIDTPEFNLTYLEEKSLFTLNAQDNKSESDSSTRYSRRRTSIDQARRREGNSRFREGLLQVPRMPPFPSNIAGMLLDRNHWNSQGEIDRRTLQYRALSRSNSFSGKKYRATNVSLKIHRHLLDEHLLGRSRVNDFDGTMNTPMTSLSADFFHPFFSIRPAKEAVRYRRNGAQGFDSTAGSTVGLLPAYHRFPPVTMEQMDSESHHANTEERSITQRTESRFLSSVDDSESDIEPELGFPRPIVANPPHLHDADEMMAVEASLHPLAMLPPVPSTNSINSNRRVTPVSEGFVPDLKMTRQVTAYDDILSNIDLDVYSASSNSLKTNNNDVIERRLIKYLEARFTVYHCCLERHLFNNDHDGFEESILDFWDEFLPQTANIQYFDKHTAVPRVSRLEKFLTSPCPRQIGIIQCEIDRVKTSSKKKGVNMKGRLFPTYEYRLFIRHRPSEQSYDLTNTASFNKNERRDTVLMVAKNRGRKNADNSGQLSKKGSNNYYLSLPLQEDLNVHYKCVNGQDKPRFSHNGIGTQPHRLEFDGLLGRLQSNFVGTEFQIFTPRSISGNRKSSLSSRNQTLFPHRTSSGTNVDDQVFCDNVRRVQLKSLSTARPRSRFGRLSIKGRNDNNVDDGVSNRIDFLESFQTKSSNTSPTILRRSRSSDATPGRNRKVSAAESFFESQFVTPEAQRTFFEEEDGAITYTANLLGSRPRIMDVCIPKVNPDGTAIEWRRPLENCETHDVGLSGDCLLNHLKKLQQNSQMVEQRRLADPSISDEELFRLDDHGHSHYNDSGLLALQNRPPWWNVELGSFVLNFGGRVSVASVKNFQLCDRNDQDHIMLQFGRIEGRHSFTMDFQYPLTAVQAFAIAISSLQSKISFG